MEPAKIDWTRIDSNFTEDELYERINAPQWVDLTAPEVPADDEAWFCRPDCKHPKTVEDFYKSPPLKLLRAISVSEILRLGSPSRRDVNLKRRGQGPLLIDELKHDGDRENQNPNFSLIQQHKAAIKSSTEKIPADNSAHGDKTRKLKSTLSARNLFGGKDILNQITEFCCELKKLARGAKERENAESVVKGTGGDEDENSGGLEERQGERKPLLEVSKEREGNADAMEKNNENKEKLKRKKRIDEAENIPLSVDLNNIKPKNEESLLQIRTCPPTPQCFSAVRGPAKITPTKALKPRLKERAILQELDQKNKQKREEFAPVNKGNDGRNLCNVAEKEAKTLDMFWFLKPCKLSSD